MNGLRTYILSDSRGMKRARENALRVPLMSAPLATSSGCGTKMFMSEASSGAFCIFSVSG